MWYEERNIQTNEQIWVCKWIYVHRMWLGQNEKLKFCKICVRIYLTGLQSCEHLSLKSNNRNKFISIIIVITAKEKNNEEKIKERM